MKKKPLKKAAKKVTKKRAHGTVIIHPKKKRG